MRLMSEKKGGFFGHFFFLLLLFLITDLDNHTFWGTPYFFLCFFLYFFFLYRGTRVERLCLPPVGDSSEASLLLGALLLGEVGC